MHCIPKAFMAAALFSALLFSAVAGASEPQAPTTKEPVATTAGYNKADGPSAKLTGHPGGPPCGDDCRPRMVYVTEKVAVKVPYTAYRTEYREETYQDYLEKVRTVPCMVKCTEYVDKQFMEPFEVPEWKTVTENVQRCRHVPEARQRKVRVVKQFWIEQGGCPPCEGCRPVNPCDFWGPDRGVMPITYECPRRVLVCAEVDEVQTYTVTVPQYYTEPVTKQVRTTRTEMRPVTKKCPVQVEKPGTRLERYTEPVTLTRKVPFQVAYTEERTVVQCVTKCVPVGVMPEGASDLPPPTALPEKKGDPAPAPLVPPPGKGVKTDPSRMTWNPSQVASNPTVAAYPATTPTSAKTPATSSSSWRPVQAERGPTTVAATKK